MSDSVRPQRRQPTRLCRPWDSPGKNTGVGCHFLLQCMKVKSEREVTQSCPTPSDPMDCSLLGSSIHEILQARVLEWGAIAFSKSSARNTKVICFFLFSWFSYSVLLILCATIIAFNKSPFYSLFKTACSERTQLITISTLKVEHIIHPWRWIISTYIKDNCYQLSHSTLWEESRQYKLNFYYYY